MSKFSAFLLLLCFPLSLWGQVKAEREFRIRKKQFPVMATEALQSYLEDARRIRFYKEIDSSRSSYEMKFKKVRLHYSVEFTPDGVLEDVEFIIKPIDIPEAAFTQIQQDLNDRFGAFRIRKMQQQYPVSGLENKEKVLRDAFQNLLVPYLNYEIIIATREESGYQEYEVLYNSEGKFIHLRKSLPANYDHVLY